MVSGSASGGPSVGPAPDAPSPRSWPLIIRAPGSSSAGDPPIPSGALRMSSPLRLGIVGAGAVTQVAHLPVLKKLKGIEIAALADGDMVKASALANRFAVPSVFEDLH